VNREWPAALDEIPDPPKELFLDGRQLDVKPAAIAIVGTRRPTAAGLEAARRFSAGLASAGFVVVSGMALGVDATAHQTALDVGGRTVAVLGCGLDVDYPSRNRNLRYMIREAGTLISEYPPTTAPAPFHFPQRNRIIAGISDAVIVIEGGATSGALITARLALECNRSVFAVPGSIRNPMAEAPNALLAEGAAAAAPNVQAVLDDLAPSLVYGVKEPQASTSALSEVERTVLCLLDDAPIALEQIARDTGVRPGALGLAISKLEVRGFANRRPGGYEITTHGARVRTALEDQDDDD
jgi:DNA processing protein